jgi:hypothetical protein
VCKVIRTLLATVLTGVGDVVSDIDVCYTFTDVDDDAR